MTEGRMNPQVKAGVLKRLADPANKQGQGKLRRDAQTPGDGKGGVCCLELVCQEAIAAGIIPPPKLNSAGLWMYGNPGDTSDSYLPAAVANWAGLGDGDGDPLIDLSPWKDRDGYAYLLGWAEMNDEMELTFLQIYDLVDYFC